MRTTSLVIMALVAITAGLEARADVADPFFWPITPQMAFSGVDRHADHVFLIHVREREHWAYGDFEDRIIPIESPDEFEPGFRRTIESVTILAVPKADYEKLPAEERKALSAKSPGVLSCEILTPQTSRIVLAPDPGVQRYDVSIADGRLSVQRAATAPRVFWWGIALAASVTWLGLVVRRRLVRKAS